MNSDPISRTMARATKFRQDRQRQITAQAEADQLAAKQAEEMRARDDQQRREAEEADRPRREAEAARLAEQARLRDEAEAKAREVAVAQARMDNARYAFEQGGFPERHRQAISTVELTEAQQHARRRIIEGLGSGAIVVLAGDRGCGKTQLATIACWDMVVRDNTHAAYWTFAELIASYREAEFNRNASGADWLRRHARVPLLVIDELGERRDTPDELHLLTRLIDLRYRELLGTLIITNTKIEHIEDEIGESAMSRLNEDGCIVVADGWPCFRDSKPKA